MSARLAAVPTLPEGINYVFSEDDMNRLRRAQLAAALLAALSSEAVSFVDVSHDSIAAVAEYIAQDVHGALNNAQRVGPASPPTRGLVTD
ncbi:hypothetical protein IEQ11_07255 [Lysobacter capsici]|uniref:hypothetical protein n=1 Tax=Lysobacter capsici TaxID=435897 RepID=UPI00177E2E15|nr:hypothetical protein [Lysobacter capsici]UOF16438.1 hypothetical protein IEQ11_07255 [Lysobacter capsici]